jgi:CelD/BcsL family acetyltransferase involved in cellulose biosynthesis
MLTTTTFEREEELDPLLRAWDELACALGQPYAGPAWTLAWWRHLRPARARLHVVAVREGDELVGLGAFHVTIEEAGTRRVRSLAARYGGTPLGPLSLPGREAEVGELLAGSLAAIRPTVHAVHLDGVASSSPWPAALRAGWPGTRPTQHREARRPLPTITLEGTTFEGWLATKSGNFRQTHRRRRRKLEGDGATVRMAGTVEEAHRDLEAFVRLHAGRWDWRGGSGRLKPTTRAFLADLAEQLVPDGRFRLWSIDLDGETISSHLFVCGGGRANYWLGGFDDRFARYSPAMVTLLAAIEHAWSVGDRSVGLGAGRQEYKSRFTDEAEDLDWMTIVPAPAWRSPRTWAGLGPTLAQAAVRNRVTPETRARLKSIVRRGGEPGPSNDG